MASGAPAALIFEDDARVSPDLAQLAGQAVEWLEAEGRRWDIVHLSKDYRKHKREVKGLGTGGLYRAYVFPILATGLLWSRDGAVAALDRTSPIAEPWDHALRRVMSKRAKCYSMLPPPVTDAGLDSDIDSQVRRAEISPLQKTILGRVRKFDIYVIAAREFLLDLARGA